jgi:pSer/pThr/pTyr-binding forkhead associated (FHA) protein
VSWKDSGVDSRNVALFLRGREVPLTDGDYVIGRGLDCDILLNDPRASRQHARLAVFGRNVTVIDLGSSNGTLRNGKRLLPGPQVLVHGDVLRMASEEIRVIVSATRSAGSSASRTSTEAPEPGAPEPSEDLEDSSASTRQSAGIQLVLVVGKKALEAGRLQEAEAVVRPYLVNVMRAAVRQRPAAPGVYTDAAAFALDLARATGNGEWFDYAVELQRLRKAPCTPELARQLVDTLQDVQTVELRYLEDYARALRSDSLDVESLGRTERLEEVMEAARRKAERSSQPGPARIRPTIADDDPSDR